MNDESMQPCNVEGDLLEVKPPRWEYFVFPLPYGSCSHIDVQDRLDMAGSDGWELIQVLQASEGLTAYLKRDRNLWNQEG